MLAMTNPFLGASKRPTGQWPDPLTPVNPAAVHHLLDDFWYTLGALPDLLLRNQYLLAAELTDQLRALVLDMMLALNGIQPRAGTRHLHDYLGASQQAAITKTLLLPAVDRESFIGQAVALVVIYRWYAPQLVTRFKLTYPGDVEEATWQNLRAALFDWPETVATDPPA